MLLRVLFCASIVSIMTGLQPLEPSAFRNASASPRTSRAVWVGLGLLAMLLLLHIMVTLPEATQAHVSVVGCGASSGLSMPPSPSAKNMRLMLMSGATDAARDPRATYSGVSLPLPSSTLSAIPLPVSSPFALWPLVRLTSLSASACLSSAVGVLGLEMGHLDACPHYPF